MTIGLKDPMLLTNNWMPAIEILQDRWQNYRQRPEYRGGRLLGVLISGDICRLYVEPLVERGPPMLFKYQGRSEFVPFPKEDDLEAFNAFIDCFYEPVGPRS
ncbi:hypothetical protein ASPACDRAFT_46509 [Aspergillus aculeatus ATCC 16872]|uniref:Uncharacterized protein n=1 Tax=Aspergillus aculeatus (strain ATCC 16872 / CBS 172.66 / WB 5094) TaxID=690307 RepID=A0A1L9WLE1_ASPA1|nr:uncharacterized protein ASPACDRAFT_46509 [Aspergillus aculeatus ATCC 16872]OJJ96985.1 hypothetical protein ASPACDRAFT_46509 [Aspergillus aculeatus ATCC 16872]